MDFSLSLFLLTLISITTTLSHAQSAQNGAVTVELWCVAKNNAEDSALQSAIDWACGAGGADCGPIQQGGPCYDAADIRRTASYAFNDYFRKNGMTDDSCNFDSTAALTSLNPSHGNCKFPSSMTVTNGSSNGTPIVELGPSGADDTSCGYCVSVRWSWALILVHFLIQITIMIL